eukprot:Gb_05807 [translate_table: standard]
MLHGGMPEQSHCPIQEKLALSVQAGQRTSGLLYHLSLYWQLASAIQFSRIDPFDFLSLHSWVSAAAASIVWPDLQSIQLMNNTCKQHHCPLDIAIMRLMMNALDCSCAYNIGLDLMDPRVTQLCYQLVALCLTSVLPAFAQVSVSSYYAASAASHYTISQLTRRIETFATHLNHSGDDVVEQPDTRQ